MTWKIFPRSFPRFVAPDPAVLLVTLVSKRHAYFITHNRIVNHNALHFYSFLFIVLFADSRRLALIPVVHPTRSAILFALPPARVHHTIPFFDYCVLDVLDASSGWCFPSNPTHDIAHFLLSHNCFLFTSLLYNFWLLFSLPLSGLLPRSIYHLLHL